MGYEAPDRIQTKTVVISARDSGFPNGMQVPQPSRASQVPANEHWLHATLCSSQLLAGSPGLTNIMPGFSRDGRFTRFATHAFEARGNVKSPAPRDAA